MLPPEANSSPTKKGRPVQPNIPQDVGDGFILVVEDDPDTRMVLSFLLSKRGYHVLEAENGRSALERLELQRPRLVLTDLQMSVMDGIELVENIRATAGLQNLPVIVMTAYTSSARKPWSLVQTTLSKSPFRWTSSSRR